MRGEEDEFSIQEYFNPIIGMGEISCLLEHVKSPEFLNLCEIESINDEYKSKLELLINLACQTSPFQSKFFVLNN